LKEEVLNFQIQPTRALT